MKVLHVVTSLITGGAQTALYRILSQLVGSGDEHAVVCLGAGEPFAPALRELGIRVSVLDGRGRLAGPRVATATRSIAAELRPDAILGWMYDGNLAATWAARGCGAALLWNVRHSVADLAQEPRGTRLAIRANAWLSRSPSVVLFNSETAARQHVTLGFPSETVRVIPNGFDTVALRPRPELRARVRGELGIPEDAFVIGKVARFHPMKDHANLLAAAQALLPDVPELHVVMAGPGVDDANEALRAEIRSRGLDQRVRLLGTRNDIAALNSSLDVAVSASAWGEGFSNAIAEALACAISVVATDVGDASTIVDGSGEVVPPRSPGQLATAILRLERMGAEARGELGRSGRARVEARYGIRSVAEQYRRVLLNAQRGHAAALQGRA